MSPPVPGASRIASVTGDDAGDLVARLRRGEGAALDRAFALHRDRLHRFLFHLCRRRDLADDLLQETFLQLARHALRLLPETDLAAWLFTVARNAWRASLRRQHAGDRALAALPDPAPAATGDPERATSSARTIARLERALASLPDEQRETILLAASGELSSEQAAAVLAIRPDAFRKRLERARAELARRLVAAEGQPATSAARRGDAP